MTRLILSALGAVLAAACQSSAVAGPIPRPTQDLPKAQPGEVRTAVLAAGCFWCVEEIFEKLEGVVEATSGYAGGTPETAKYPIVSSGRTSHAESVEIKYDHRISYAELLWVFLSTQDPTTKDAQGPDHGPQYRSAIFVKSKEERQVAEAYLAELAKANPLGKPLVTTIETLTTFHPAEGYHQDYVRNHPDAPYVRTVSIPRASTVEMLFPKLLKQKR
ncbi:MAG: peptide-methionine (S)-S-oxide reductase MsrA [Deltaproteobacteria bacterium]|nr:peptide-methionine (S)-S-oxide reductase MsrA [Deltaproteobacteria bacterium]